MIYMRFGLSAHPPLSTQRSNQLGMAVSHQRAVFLHSILKQYSPKAPLIKHQIECSNMPMISDSLDSNLFFTVYDSNV